MSDMVERAAKALFLKGFRVEEVRPPSVTWEEHAAHSVQHAAYLEAVRTVFEAMREPTDDMVLAGVREVQRDPHWHRAAPFSLWAMMALSVRSLSKSFVLK